MQYQNPVIPGFYPDPSVCRANGKYYLVTSSFQYFPGVPLFESSDLVNWRQIGHVLTRPSQLPLKGANSVGGIYAPTIRCSEGWFYMVTTNVSGGGHFFVRTNDIYGEWSDPVWIRQEGIDPSLFFEDGRAYFMCNGGDDQGSCIFQCELDLTTGEPRTPMVPVWRGTGGRFLESPHLYHIGRYYYIMASEGGTEYGHMVTYARGETPYGPFTAYPGNPVLTNRNLGGYPLQGCGHGDLVQDDAGHWWMLHLGFRQIDRWMMFHTTGREVNLTPVSFDENGWFTAGENGTARLTVTTDRLPKNLVQSRISRLDFTNTQPGREWVWLQNPDMAHYALDADCFALTGTAVPLSAEDASPTWIGIRQQEMQFTLSVDVQPGAAESGVTVYMTGGLHYDLLLRRTPAGLGLLRRAVLGSLIHETPAIPVPENARIRLLVTGSPCSYAFAAELDGVRHDLGALESKFLSTETAGNFTGVMLGLFAQDAAGGVSRFAAFSLVYA